MPEFIARATADYERRYAENEASQGLFVRFLSTRFGLVFGSGTAFLSMYTFYCLDDVSSEVQHIFAWGLRQLGPDRARSVLLKIASVGLLPKDYDKDDPYMVIQLQEGLVFHNPVGLAAGFDTEAVGVNSFLDSGFGFVEVGPVGTGAADGPTVWQRLAKRDKTKQVVYLGRVGVTIVGDREELLGHLSAMGPHVDFVTIDVSTVLQQKPSELQLKALVADAVKKAAEIPGGGPALLLRLQLPPLGSSEAEAAWRSQVLATSSAALAGGACGVVLPEADFLDVNSRALDDSTSSGRAARRSRQLALDTISEVFRETEGRISIIASGGVQTGRDALDRIEAGASVVQISSLILRDGPQACRTIKTELTKATMFEAHVNLPDAVGAVIRKRKGKSKMRNTWQSKGPGA